jgi:hypothetical protein
LHQPFESLEFIIRILYILSGSKLIYSRTQLLNDLILLTHIIIKARFGCCLSKNSTILMTENTERKHAPKGVHFVHLSVRESSPLREGESQDAPFFIVDPKCNPPYPPFSEGGIWGVRKLPEPKKPKKE